MSAAPARALADLTSTPGIDVPRASALRSLVQRVDAGMPLAAKVALPVIAVIVLAVGAFLAVAVPALRGELEDQYVVQAGQVASVVEAEYAAVGADRAALSASLRDHVRFDPSIRLIRVYRIVSGSPVLWASSDPAGSAATVPDPYDVEPVLSGASLHRIDVIDGERMLEAVYPLSLGNSIDASVGIYSALDAVDATSASVTRLVVVATLVGAALEAILIGLILQLVVLRPIGHLRAAARRVAAGDLSGQPVEAGRSPSRDAIVEVRREFDHMVGAVGAQRAAAAAAAVRLREEKLALERANDELESLYRQQGRFVSVVSHEFRTPLTGIQGFSEILRDDAVTATEVREFAEDINREARRLGRLIGDMLDLDRMRSGKMTLRLDTVDLDELIREAAHHAATAAADHPFTLRLDAAHPLVRGDRDRLVQVLTNLVSNAAKYSPRDGPIEISTAVRDGSIDVAVRDRGVGIPADQLAQVFEPYTRLEEGSTRAVGGTGLGLSIVREILRLHGGAVWVESVLGQGSTFHFTVPLASAEPGGVTG